MLWFKGNIPDAINIAKSKGSLFVVYIYGEDEMSQEMEKCWESDEVTKSLEGTVAIRIQNTSEECKHFARIYPVVIVPVMFCIGENGVPLEVIGGPQKPDELVLKIGKVQQMHAEQKQSLAAAAQRTEQLVTVPSTQAPTTSGRPETAASGSGASGDQASALPLEQKVEKAKQLLEKKRTEKGQSEFEKQREEEVKRRKLGQDLQKLKSNQAEVQMKEIKDQMKKDKEEEKKAKERIRQQIARDREDRQARYDKGKKDREQLLEDKKREKLLQQQAEAAAEEARKSESARIQVRLPDGSSVTQNFNSSDPLQALHSVMSERLGGRNVVFQQVYPKRRFTAEDMSSSFTDLQLAPSAVLIALPGGHSSRQASSSVQSGGIIAMLLSPFMLIWNFVYTLLFGRGNSESGSAQPSSQAAETAQTGTRSDRPSTAYQRRTAPSREGNTRRLADLRDDDDDMSTYNGNSTQQL